MTDKWTIQDISYLAPSLHLLECAYMLDVLVKSSLPLDTWEHLEKGLQHYGVVLEGEKRVNDLD